MIAVQGLGCDIGGVKALDDVSFLAGAGQIVGIVGPNGAGKTTLFDVVCGDRRANRGAVTVNGVRLDGLPPHRVAAHGVARTHQAPRLFSRLTVFENVLAGTYLHAGNHAARAASAKNALDAFGLIHRATEPARYLDGEERCRLELARCFAAAPVVALLDEPFASLGASAKEMVRARITGFARDRACTFLVADRDVGACLVLCDRVIVLHAGKSIGEGPPDAVAQDADVRDAYLGVAWRQ